MPTYVCSVRAGWLSDIQKAAIAGAITCAHSAATGAPHYFVQVLIEETTGSRFLGGAPASDHIWVRADIRAGRSHHQKAELMRTIVVEVARIAGVPTDGVWVYLNELAATDMIEYGHVLPEPGDEQVWFDALPPELRLQLGALDSKKPFSL